MRGMEKSRARRKVIVVDNRPLAERIGRRIRASRQAAGMSQRQLAAGRFTGAYISALEKGIAKPSLASLAYISERLGVPIRHFLENELPAWTRLEADTRLASGDAKGALEMYQRLLRDAVDQRTRAELLLSTAEALCRLGLAAEAVDGAREAVELFASQGRARDKAHATYWLAIALHQHGNLADARAALRDVLARVNGRLDLPADLRARALSALAQVELWEGDEANALSHLQEAKSLVEGVDQRSRAAFLFQLAEAHRVDGDFDRALRTAGQSLALFQAADAEGDVVTLNNSLALANLRLGRLERARELAAQSRAAAEQRGDDSILSLVADTEAAIALAQQDYDVALSRAEDAVRLAQEVGNRSAAVSAQVTRARVQLARGERKAAGESFESAVDVLREHGPWARLQQVLREWADALSSGGDHARANQLYREALGEPG